MPDDAPAPLPPSLQRSADRLARTLAAQNRAVYRRALADHAAAFGQTAPRHVQSRQVTDAIADRAQASAESITRTHMQARQRFYEQAGDVDGAKALYKQWIADRADTVAAFEAGMAANAAARDFRSRNAGQVQGTAHVEPTETDSSDVCADLIAAGGIALTDVQDDLPAHPRCPHSWVLSYDQIDDAAGLWVGGPDDDEESDDDG